MSIGGDDDLVIRARVDDDATAELRDIRGELGAVGREADTAGRLAGKSARGFTDMGKAGRVAAGAAKAAFVGVVAAGYGAVRIIQSSITEASSLNESLNAVNLSYGKQAKAVKKLGREAAKSIGLSNVEFNGLAVRFSSFSKTIAGNKGGPAVVKTLDNLTTRAADFASVMNLDVSQAAELFQSGLAGETEPLRAYGMDLSAAKVAAYAYAEGIAKTGEDLTEAQKVQARYGSLMEQTAAHAGDFKNTSDGLANSTRTLAARFDNAKAKLGSGLVPIAERFVRFLNREGVPAFLRFSDWFTDKGIPAISRFARKARPLAEQVLPAMKDALSTIRDVIGDVAPKLEAVFRGFNNLPKWAKSALVIGAGGAAVGAKLGVLGKVGKAAGGAASTALGIASKARPVPVLVTNPGFGGGPGGKAGTAAKVGGGLLAGVALPVAAAAAGIIGAKLLSDKATDYLRSDGRGERQQATSEATARGVYADAQTHRGAAELPDMGGTAAGQADYLKSQYGGAQSASADYFKAIEGGAYRSLTALKSVGGETKNLKGGLEGVARTKVNPKIAPTGFPEAQNKTDNLKGALEVLRSTTYTARADVDTSAAYAKLSALRASAKLAANPGSPVPGAQPREPRALGGRVIAGREYLVGEQRAELFRPDRSGRIVPRVPEMAGGGGGIVVESGGIVVNAQGASSTVDVAQAVQDAIRAYVTEREERA